MESRFRKRFGIFCLYVVLAIGFFGCTTIEIQAPKGYRTVVRDCDKGECPDDTSAPTDEELMAKAAGVGATQKHYGRRCVDDSCASGYNLDDIVGASDGDTAVVPADPTYGGPLYYLYDVDSGVSESLPNIVDDGSVGGDQRWILQTLPTQAGGTSASTPAVARENLEINESTKCFLWEDPVDTDDYQSVYTPTDHDVIVTYVWCESDGTVTVDLNNDDGSPASIIGSYLTCDATPATACSSGCDTTIVGDSIVSQGDQIDIVVNTVADSPTWVSMCFTLGRQ